MNINSLTKLIRIARLVMFILFLSLCNILKAQNNRSNIKIELAELNELKSKYGISSDIYNEKLTTLAYDYSGHREYYSYYDSLVNLIIQNESNILKQYGVDSEYYQVLMTSLLGCLDGKFCDPNYSKYSNKAIKALKKLGSVIDETNRNKIEFNTILSYLYDLYEPNYSLAIKYGKEKFELSKAKYGLQSRASEYAIDNLLALYAKNDEIKKINDLLNLRRQNWPTHTTEYHKIIIKIINRISSKVSYEFLSSLINDINSITSINEYRNFIRTMSNSGRTDILALFEQKLSKDLSIKDLYEYYYSVGLNLGYRTNKIEDGVNYLFKAKELCENNHKASLLIENIDGDTRHLFDFIASIYENSNRYFEASIWKLKSRASFLKLNYQDRTLLNNLSSQSSYLFMRHFRDNKNNPNISDDIKYFLSEYLKTGGSLLQLSALYNEYVQTADYRFTSLFDDIIKSEKDNYALYDFYLTYGIYLHNQKHYKDAILNYKKALYYAKFLNNDKLYLFSDFNGKPSCWWIDVAFCYYYIEDYANESLSYLQALKTIQEVYGKTSEEYYETYKAYDTSIGLHGNIQTCLSNDDVLIDLSKRLYGDTSVEYISNLVSKGCNLRYAHEHMKAIAHFKTILPIIKYGDIETKKNLFLNIAMCYEHINDVNNATKYFQESLKQTDRKKDKIDIYSNMLQMYCKADLSEATSQLYLNLLEKELSSAKPENIVDSCSVNFAYNVIAKYFVYKDSKKALHYLDTSERYRTKNNHRLRFIYLLDRIELEKDPFISYNNLLEAEGIHERYLNDDETLWFILQKSWGHFYYYRDDMVAAYRHYKRCEEYYSKDSVDLNDKISFLVKYADCINICGYTEKAVSFYLKALTLTNESYKSKSIDAQYIINKLIRLYLDNNDIANASKFLLDYQNNITVENERFCRFDLHYLLGRLLILQNNSTMAEKEFQESLKYTLSDMQKESCLSRLLELYKQEKSEKILNIVDPYLNILKKNLIFSLINQTQQERNSNIIYLSSFKNQFIGATQDFPKIATYGFELSLFTKGLLFYTTKEGRNELSQHGEGQKHLDDYMALKESLYKTVNNEDLLTKERLEQSIEYKERFIHHKYITNKKLYSVTNHTINDVLTNIGGNGIAVDFVAYRIQQKVLYGAYILSAKTKNLIFVKICSEDQILKYKELKSSYASKTLCRIIWEKVSSHISPEQDIYFSADGLLNQLPVEFLLTDDDLPINQKYKLHRVFHLADISHVQSIGNEILIVGINDYNSPIKERDTLINRGNWSNLPNVLTEVRIIEKNVQNIKGVKVSTYMNHRAQEAQIKELSNSSISLIHFATHGFYKNDSILRQALKNPMHRDHFIAKRTYYANQTSMSGLILSAGNLYWKSNVPVNHEDGILTNWEIENLNFPKLNLCVLSACQTGVGLNNTEGVWGLQRAFRIAGAKNLICSLNNIDDKVTAQFMNTFYSYLSEGYIVHDAFHQAQYSIYKKYKNNINLWSSFILIE